MSMSDNTNNIETELEPENNVFQCSECGHYTGDPHTRSFYKVCPGCERIVRFFRIID